MSELGRAREAARAEAMAAQYQYERALKAEADAEALREENRPLMERARALEKDVADLQSRVEALREALREVDDLLRVCEEAPAKKGAQIKKARRIIDALDGLSEGVGAQSDHGNSPAAERQRTAAPLAESDLEGGE